MAIRQEQRTVFVSDQVEGEFATAGDAAYAEASARLDRWIDESGIGRGGEWSASMVKDAMRGNRDLVRALVPLAFLNVDLEDLITGAEAALEAVERKRYQAAVRLLRAALRKGV